ncbi:hypothetical protein KCP74_23330 [Salmonella enterica subsp. enterica]|nr:hypothetical protein KCP74_23330 [Salmonella enterica subsp. enterica]
MPLRRPAGRLTLTRNALPVNLLAFSIVITQLFARGSLRGKALEDFCYRQN